MSATHKLWINAATRRLVAGPNATQQALPPEFTQGDTATVEVYLLQPTGDLSQPFESLAFPSGSAVKLAVGHIDAKPAAGTWKLSWGGDETTALQPHASAADLQSALNALVSISAAGGVTVQGPPGGPFTIFFNTAGNRDPFLADPSALLPYSQLFVSTIRDGDVSNTEIQRLKLKQGPAAYQNVWTDLADLSASVTRQTAGSSTLNEIQRVAFYPQPYGGFFTLAFDDNVTNQLAWNASADLVQSAFTALASVGAGNAIISKVATGVYDIQFVGGLGYAAQDLVAADVSGLLVYPGKTASVGFSAPAIEDLHGGLPYVDTSLEIVIEDASGNQQTHINTPCRLYNDMIEGAVTIPVPYDYPLQASLFSANSILVAHSAGSPEALSIGPNTFLARASTGDMAAQPVSDFAFTLLDDADQAAVQSTLGLVVGSHVQPYDATLDTLSGHTITTFGLSLLDDATAATARDTLGAAPAAALAAAESNIDGNAAGLAALALLDDAEPATGEITIRYADIDFTDTPASVGFFFPSGGRQFAATAAWIVPTAVSSPNGDAAVQIDNGTSGQDTFASKTLTAPTVGQLIPLSLASAPYLADASNPLRLRRAIADSGVTFIGDLYVKGEYNA